MTGPIVSPRTYLVVLVLLLGLTILTVAISFAPLAGEWHIVCGLAIGAFKASLVILFFMHVLSSTVATRRHCGVDHGDVHTPDSDLYRLFQPRHAPRHAGPLKPRVQPCPKNKVRSVPAWLRPSWVASECYCFSCPSWERRSAQLV